MKLRLRYKHWLPRILNAEAVVIYPYILFEESKSKVKSVTLRHEMIHVRQVRRLGVVKLYLLYSLYYVRDLIRYRDFDEAYFNNPFEEEAYADEDKIVFTREEKREIREG